MKPKLSSVGRIIGYSILKYSKYTNHESKRFSSNNNHVFFGYYDITPFSSDDRILLANQVSIKDGVNQRGPMEIGYYDLNDSQDSFNKLGETTTWCWQMGCRLRWFPDGDSSSVVYNTMIDHKYGSVVVDIDKRTVVKRWDYPLYDINFNGTLGVSLNFSRLQRLRPGYGYNNRKDSTEGEFSPKTDGLFLIDLDNNDIDLLVTLDQVRMIEPTGSMGNAEHYFNHISFSPESTRLIFFHFWRGNKRRYSRLFSYDILMKRCKIISYNNVSHFAWINDRKLLVTENEKNSIVYRIYDLKSGDQETIGQHLLKKDGHPTILEDSKTIVSDTFPDRFGYQHLFRYGITKNELTVLSKHYSPTKYIGEYKCDLHPRLCHNNNMICIDTVENGKREMVLIDNFDKDFKV